MASKPSRPNDRALSSRGSCRQVLQNPKKEFTRIGARRTPQGPSPLHHMLNPLPRAHASPTITPPTPCGLGSRQLHVSKLAPGATLGRCDPALHPRECFATSQPESLPSTTFAAVGWGYCTPRPAASNVPSGKVVPELAADECARRYSTVDLAKSLVPACSADEEQGHSFVISLSDPVRTVQTPPTGARGNTGNLDDDEGVWNWLQLDGWEKVCTCKGQSFVDPKRAAEISRPLSPPSPGCRSQRSERAHWTLA